MFGKAHLSIRLAKNGNFRAIFGKIAQLKRKIHDFRPESIGK
jgi:hypothetical protein